MSKKSTTLNIKRVDAILRQRTSNDKGLRTHNLTVKIPHLAIELSRSICIIDNGASRRRTTPNTRFRARR